MNIMTRQSDRKMKTVLIGIILLLLAYGSASWAIDDGSVLLYFATLILVIAAVRHFSIVLRKT